MRPNLWDFYDDPFERIAELAQRAQPAQAQPKPVHVNQTQAQPEPEPGEGFGVLGNRFGLPGRVAGSIGQYIKEMLVGYPPSDGMTFEQQMALQRYALDQQRFIQTEDHFNRNQGWERERHGDSMVDTTRQPLYDNAGNLIGYEQITTHSRDGVIDRQLLDRQMRPTNQATPEAVATPLMPPPSVGEPVITRPNEQPTPSVGEPVPQSNETMGLTPDEIKAQREAKDRQHEEEKRRRAEEERAEQERIANEKAEHEKQSMQSLIDDHPGLTGPAYGLRGIGEALDFTRRSVDSRYERWNANLREWRQQQVQKFIEVAGARSMDTPAERLAFEAALPSEQDSKELFKSRIENTMAYLERLRNLPIVDTPNQTDTDDIPQGWEVKAR